MASKINAFSNNKNLIYAATLRESQRLMCWRLIIKEFGPNIQHIVVVDIIVADTLRIFSYNPSYKCKLCTRKAQCCTDNLFTIGRIENNEDYFPLNLLILQGEQEKIPRNIDSKLSTYISDRGSGYSMEYIDDVEIICYDRKVYVPQSLHIHGIDWYNFYLNQPGGSRLLKTIQEICYWKGLVMQANLYVNTCKTYQQSKERKTICGNLKPKIISELKP